MFRRRIHWCCIFVAVSIATNHITESLAVQPQPGAVEATIVHQGPPAGDRSPVTAASAQADSSSARAAATAACRSPPPGDAAVSLLQSLSGEEKGSRLIQAAKEGAVEQLQALLAAGVDVGWRDADLNYTALHWASFKGHAQVVRCLLEGGAPVDARNNNQATALHFAAGSDHANVVRLLVGHSADPNAGDVDQQTPLHWAAEAGHTEAAAVLLAAGADPGARDVHGSSPLDLARQNNYQQLVGLLSSS